MKILHTSDWHLGHRLHENSQFEEQSLFLDWLKNHIEKENIDILLISGDIFDTRLPSSQSEELYYNFIVSLRETQCKHIIITGGNHDSPDRLNAPKALLNALSIQVVGKSTGINEDENFKLKVGYEEVIVAAVPYLRDQDIRRAVAGETFDEITDKYKTALINHYENAAQYCMSISNGKIPIIAMGHLFAIGGTVSDSEQNIYVGSLGHIGAEDFPKAFDYIALGHLHRPQIVGGINHIRYAGSPVILSFSELNYDKKIFTISIENSEISKIEETIVPRFRNIYRVTGDLNTCVHQLEEIASAPNQLMPWAEVILDNAANPTIGAADIKTAIEGLRIEVLKITLKSQGKTMGLEELIENTKQLKELTPHEVFEQKCTEAGLNLSDNQEILDAFSEAVTIAREL